MKNRNGMEYNFVKTGDNEYQIVGNLSHWRMGGREGQNDIDYNDLGFVDPAGGPFVEVGSKIEGRTVKKIRATGGKGMIFFEVE